MLKSEEKSPRTMMVRTPRSEMMMPTPCARDEAREYDVTGPEQRGQAEQQIGLVAEPGEREMRFRLGRHVRLRCVGLTSTGMRREVWCYARCRWQKRALSSSVFVGWRFLV